MMNTKLKNSIFKVIFFSLFLCSTISAFGNCNVNASFTVSVDKNRTITINNTSTGANRYQWILGDGNTSAQSSPIHQYNDLGVYIIYLTAYDTTLNNCFDTASYIIDIPGCRIKADFRYNVVNGDEVYFTNFSEYYNSGYVQFYWDFGNTNVSSMKDPVNYYNDIVMTTYTVRLIVLDTSLGNCRDSVVTTITTLKPCDTNDFTYDFITDKKV
ncbi:MAG TPA: PKD domain-containing protein, partial [Bacteroidia bacterium]